MPEYSLPFYKVSPGGNPTTLVFTAGTGLNPKQYPHVAAKLMRPEQIGGEQVGFVNALSETPQQLTMMGGEFCGNACRALAAVIHLAEGGPAKGALLCSGMESPVTYEVTRNNLGETTSTIEFPLLPEQFRITELDSGMHLVELPGISHIILNERRYAQTMDLAWSASILRKRYALENREAVGVIWFTLESCAAGCELFTITPVVWVRGTNTIHTESACGSGTLAFSLFMQHLRETSKTQKSNDNPNELIAVRQPSGAIFYSGICHDTQNAIISGPVIITAKGTAFIAL